MSLLESCLQGALSEVLEEEMKAAYGELWMEVPLHTLIYYFFMKFILRAAPHLSKCISHVLSVIQGSDSL